MIGSSKIFVRNTIEQDVFSDTILFGALPDTTPPEKDPELAMQFAIIEFQPWLCFGNLCIPYFPEVFSHQRRIFAAVDACLLSRSSLIVRFVKRPL